MPCEFCYSYQHTLSVCEQIDVAFYANELRFMTIDRHENVTKQYVSNLRLPILKRLIRHLGGAMSQTRRVLEQRCLEYTELLRVREIIERENMLMAAQELAEISMQEDAANADANTDADMAVDDVDVDVTAVAAANTDAAIAADVAAAVEAAAVQNRERIVQQFVIQQMANRPGQNLEELEAEADARAAARGQRPRQRPQTIVQQMATLSDQSWEERRIRRENTAISQIREEQNRIHNEERSLRIRSFLRNLGVPSQQQVVAAQQGGIASLAQAAPLATPPNTKPVIQVKVNIIDPTACDKHTVLETCCICLESDSYIQTNCGHVFCNCILQHTSKNGVKCPMCRQALTSLAYSCKTQYETTSRLGDMLNMGRVSYEFN